eukprot:CAMPEP_0173463992 /NCGR_PEP_ID=MMETSP1357-20121228/69200_1 /TAXON_ID=77926 /ORGANISM="Hemiselmis rufescens, Strain PCC563" /LENGTH=54 /DNA_ID=CAMNT_0014431849 /DNA_START=11 /DNA_END=172 /DNA_ORIENTATION=+
MAGEQEGGSRAVAEGSGLGPIKWLIVLGVGVVLILSFTNIKSELQATAAPSADV